MTPSRNTTWILQVGQLTTHNFVINRLARTTGHWDHCETETLPFSKMLVTRQNVPQRLKTLWAITHPICIWLKPYLPPKSDRLPLVCSRVRGPRNYPHKSVAYKPQITPLNAWFLFTAWYVLFLLFSAIYCRFRWTRSVPPRREPGSRKSTRQSEEEVGKQYPQEKPSLHMRNVSPNSRHFIRGTNLGSTKSIVFPARGRLLTQVK